jgi:hypothetical protein
MTRDRTGDDVPEPGEHRCDRGWIDRDNARPCMACRPWLRYHRPPTRAELAAFEARHPKPARRNGGA